MGLAFGRQAEPGIGTGFPARSLRRLRHRAFAPAAPRHAPAQTDTSHATVDPAGGSRLHWEALRAQGTSQGPEGGIGNQGPPLLHAPTSRV